MMLDAMKDRRLYGRSFFVRSAPFVGFGLFIQSVVLFVLNRQMLWIYVPVYFGIILLSALAAKNSGREFHAMDYWLGLLFLLASVLAETFAFTAQVENTLFGFFQKLLMLSISNLALVVSILNIAVSGQRVSLRESVGLTDDFFGKQNKIWKDKLAGLPNLDKICDGLVDARFVAGLFDRGSFNLTVLWSCIVMEKIIDATADGIISKDPEKAVLFKTEDGRSQNYPRQLKNLGYESCRENGDKKKSLDVDTLWNVLRNKVAHRNYTPTFHETYGALRILVSFMKEMPKTLEAWRPPER